ncbi:MAG: ATP-binding protein [Pseudomonadota bacterium]
MEQSTERMQFSISSSFENVADLAERVSEVCGTHAGQQAESIDMLRLCLAEALNNIVEHAYSGATGKPIFADVSFSDHGYEVLLIDEGRPMPGGALPECDLEFEADDIDNLPEGGFGWMLIKNEMDKVDYERRDGCNVLRLEKYIT